MSLLTNTEMQYAGEDLQSWLLQDEEFLYQDFCEEAKERQPYPAGHLLEEVPLEDKKPGLQIDSTPNVYDELDAIISSPSMKKEACSNLPESQLFNFQDDSISIDDIMRMEMMQQQQMDMQMFSQQQEDLQQLEDLVVPMTTNQTSQDYIHPDAQFILSDEVISQELASCEVAQPISIDVAESISPPEIHCSSSEAAVPSIISVPVSDAYEEECSAITVESVHPLESQPIFIDLGDGASEAMETEMMDESIPEIIVQSPDYQGQSQEMTLKDHFEVNSADSEEFIRSLIKDSPCSTSTLSPSYQQSEASITDSEESLVASPLPARKNGRFSATEKRLRKKEQNKRAALRYRQKKKHEEDSLMDSLRKEEKRHKEAKKRLQDVLIELKLMKKLARSMMASRKENSK